MQTHLQPGLLSQALRWALCVVPLINVQSTSLGQSTQIDANAFNAISRKAITINSIDWDDTDFTDLNKPIPLLKDVRVLGLGENRHDDGATFKAKLRLVKFLHEKLGFDVLAFESSFYGGHVANAELDRDSTNLKNVERNLSGWFHSEFVYPLMEYAKGTRKNSSPLVLAGFDDEKQPNAIPNNREIIRRLYEASDWITVHQEVNTKVDSLVLAISGALGNTYWPAFKEGKSRYDAMRELKKLLAEVESNPVKLLGKLTREEYLWLKFGLKSFLMTEESLSDSYYGTVGWNMRRDNFMSKRIQWLADSLYPGKKIILWAATGHLARNFITINRREPSEYYLYSAMPYYQTGDFLSQTYGDQYYCIGFTSYQGEYGLLFEKYKTYEYREPVPPSEPNSVEDLLHRMKKPYVFLDLRNGRTPELTKPRMAHPLGYTNDLAEWHNVLDAFFSSIPWSRMSTGRRG